MRYYPEEEPHSLWPNHLLWTLFGECLNCRSFTEYKYAAVIILTLAHSIALLCKVYWTENGSVVVSFHHQLFNIVIYFVVGWVCFQYFVSNLRDLFLEGMFFANVRRTWITNSNIFCRSSSSTRRSTGTSDRRIGNPVLGKDPEHRENGRRPRNRIRWKRYLWCLQICKYTFRSPLI